MTDNEIIKALEDEIRLTKYVGRPCADGVSIKLIKNTIDLINCQKAEIERMEKRLDMSRKELSRRRERNIQNSELNLKLLSELKIVKSEAIKEFAERLKETPLRFRISYKTHWNEPPKEKMVLFIDDKDIDNLVKEMTEGGNGDNS